MSVYILALLTFICHLVITPQFQLPPSPVLQLWSEATSVNESELLQQTARIPVSWAVTNRPDDTHLVFEQMIGGNSINVELPRDNLWVASSGDGVVAPVFPGNAQVIQLSVRLVRLSDGATLATAELALAISRPDQWSMADSYTCYQQPPYPPHSGLEPGIYGLVRDYGQLDVWDVPSPRHQVIGSLEPGEKILMLDGVYCYTWPDNAASPVRLWHVSAVDRTLEGWVEEYVSGTAGEPTYTLTAFPEIGTFFHYFAPDYCDEQRGFLPNIGLLVGAKARVTDEASPLGLPLMDSPTWHAGQDVGSRYLALGEIVTVIEGPVCFRVLWHTTSQANFRLWRVRSERSGTEGWTAEYWSYMLDGTKGYYLALANDDTTSDAQVLSFVATPDPVEHGGTITLSWHVTGISTVAITRLSERGGIFEYQLLDASSGSLFPAQGSVTYTIPDRYVEQIPFVLTSPGQGTLATLTVQIICPFSETLTEACPLTRQSIPAAFQPFENGYMVWRGDTNEIYVFYDDGFYAEFTDTWVEGQSIPMIDTPPAGRVIPARGFGHLWSIDSTVREQLGWALSSETAYTMIHEVYPGVWNRPDTQWFTLPDGRVLSEYPHRWDVKVP